MKTISSRTFNQKLGEAKKDALEGPVYITDRSNPTHVLLSYEQYQALLGEGKKIGDLLGNPAASEIDFEPETVSDLATGVDF